MRLGIVGDSLLLDYSLNHFGDKTADDIYGYPLYAMPLAGGNLTTVLTHVGPSVLQTGADGAVAIGGSSLTDYGARRLTAAPDGAVTVTAADSDPGGPVPDEGVAMARAAAEPGATRVRTR